jgi:outer membrane scaffolding protein for murein synthesis (MipA/OmpV family)
VTSGRLSALALLAAAFACTQARAQGDVQADAQATGSARAAAGAQAAAPADAPPALTEPLWEAGFGAGALSLPLYRGSDRQRSWLLPVPYFVYRGDFLRADRDGARAQLARRGRVELDLGFGASPPTRDEPGGAREGMPALPPTVEIGPRLNVRLAEGAHWRADLRVPLRAVVALQSSPRAVGWTLEPTVGVDVDWQGLQLGALVGAVRGDRRLHQHLYGVTAAQARTGRPAYDARGGDAGWQITLGASQRRGRLWLGAFVRHDVVGGSVVDDSPLVKARRGTAFGLAASWVFARSAAQVPVAR